MLGNYSIYKFMKISVEFLDILWSGELKYSDSYGL